MFFSSFSWVLFTLTLLVALPGALASSSPKRGKKTSSTHVTVETYPAMEDGEIVVPHQASIPALEPKEIRRVQTLGVPAPTSAPAPVAFRPIPKFEFVPAEKRPQILQRIRLCQSLFEESGRAYDYRSMTTAELEQELMKVRGGQQIAVQKKQELDPILDAQE